MKHIFLNLKRFDVPVEYGGVNRIAPIQEWGAYIVRNTQEALRLYNPEEVEFVQYFPEAHLIGAAAAKSSGSPVQVGCQGVYRMSTAIGGNFGAFSTNRPASAMKALGVSSVIIGHCEERTDKLGIMMEAGVTDTAAVNRVLNQEIRQAVDCGMSVLYCIGEDTGEMDCWKEVLEEQLADEEYGIAFQKENQELAALVLGALDELVKDGTAAQISQKWFGEDRILFSYPGA